MGSRALFAASVLASAAPIAATNALSSYVPEVMEFDAWRLLFGVTYATPADARTREGVFAANVAVIRRHNDNAAASGATYRMGVNAFTDRTQSEFRRTRLGYVPPSNQPSADRVRALPVGAQAGPIDWRERGAVTSVKDQGGCGSCWVFSATGAIEGHYEIATGALRSLSEQEIVDCFAEKDGRGTGCQGGEMRKAFDWVIKNHGIDSELDYNYTGEDGVCWTNATRRDVATIDSWVAVPANDTAQLAAAVQLGPVSVAIEADQGAFQHYKSGVFNGACGINVDHGVLVVGLTDDAFIVKNSWGASWGEDGYIRMARSTANKTGVCGIATQASYPIKAKGTPAPVPPKTPGERPGLNHFCGCPPDDGECALLGQHCCCFVPTSGDITCQEKPVTNESQCCKPCH